MAESTLSAYLRANPGKGPVEGAVEVLLTALEGGLQLNSDVPLNVSTAAVAAPTFGEGTDQPLSVDLKGALRVSTKGSVADNGVAGDFPSIVGGVATDPASLPTYTAGDVAALRSDLSGSLLANTRKLTVADDALVATPVASALANNVAYATSLVVKVSAGRLFSINGYNSKATAQFIQVLNSATLPADTAIPVAVITVPGLSNFSIDFGPLGIPLSTGIVLSNSSTGPTKTIGSADCYFTASYV